VAQPYRVTSSSMLPGLEPGDVVLADKRAYGFRLPFAREAIGAEPPRRGDVVLFRSVEGDEEEVPGEVVKRVIGLPGDHVAMVNGHPVINGEEVPSCAAGTFIYFTAGQVAHGRLEVELLDGTKYLVVREIMPIPFAGYDVRPGEVFVLGDNRGSSNDSRSWRARYGAGVPFTSIDGRLERILVGTRRDGHLDLDRLGKRLGVDLHLPGVDASALEAGIRRCLENVDRGGR
jgi:signal peptidase I